MEEKASKCWNPPAVVGDINGMDAIRYPAGSREGFPCVTFCDRNGGEHFPVRGDAYFKAAIHVASGTDIDPCDVPAVKIFEAGGCAVRNVFPGGKKRVQCLFFIRTSFEPEAGREGQSIRQHSEDGFLHSHGIQVKHCMDHP